MAFPVTEKAHYQNSQHTTLHGKADPRPAEKARAEFSFAFRQGWSLRSPKCVHSHRKSGGHNDGGAIHHSYRLIKIT